MSDSTPNIDQYKGNYYISSDEVLELRRRISELEVRNEELEAQLKQAELAIDELSFAVDGYYIQSGDWSTPEHMKYEREYGKENDGG